MTGVMPTGKGAMTGGRKMASAGLLMLLVWLQGCGSLPSGTSPSPADMKRAALDAVADPNTWLPALGATLFLVTDRDQAVSDWARRKHPVFSSRSSARQTSDVLLYTSVGVALASSLWVPEDGEDPARPSRLAVQLGAMATNGLVTQTIKLGAGRPRPDDSDNLSFPSGHASVAFTGATLARRNFARLDLQASTRMLLSVGAGYTIPPMYWPARRWGISSRPSSMMPFCAKVCWRMVPCGSTCCLCEVGRCCSWCSIFNHTKIKQVAEAWAMPAICGRYSLAA